MSAQTLERSATALGRPQLRLVDASPETVSSAAAAKVLGVTKSHVLRLVRRGRISAELVDGAWRLDLASVRAWRDRPRPVRRPGPTPRRRRGLQADPLLNLIDRRGGVAACGVLKSSAEEKAIERARSDGQVSLAAGDYLAIKVLGLTPWEIWGDEWAAVEAVSDG